MPFNEEGKKERAEMQIAGDEVRLKAGAGV